MQMLCLERRCATSNGSPASGELWEMSLCFSACLFKSLTKATLSQVYVSSLAFAGLKFQACSKYRQESQWAEHQHEKSYISAAFSDVQVSKTALNCHPRYPAIKRQVRSSLE